MQYFTDLFAALASNIVLKTLISILGGFLVYLIGSQNLAAFAVVASLCFIDTLMAFYVLHKNDRAVSSKRLPDKIYNLAVYAVVIMTMNLLTLINPHLVLLVDMAILYCASTEALSILEHAAALGYKIPISILKDIRKNTE